MDAYGEFGEHEAQPRATLASWETIFLSFSFLFVGDIFNCSREFYSKILSLENFKALVVKQYPLF